MRCLALATCLLLAGCATWPAPDLFAPDGAQVSEAQACAIGYDLAREIHSRVSLRRVVIVHPADPAPCTRHALGYLRRGGFRIDMTGQGGVAFDIAVMPANGDGVTAIASLGADLRIARTYRPVRTGVIAETAVSIQHLNSDTYSPRKGDAS